VSTTLMALFQDAAATVPAYAEFLRRNGVEPGGVAGPVAIPLMTKQNYHQAFPLPERCRGGRLASADIVALSSGSSGRATVWPRAAADEQAVFARFEQVFADGFRAGVDWPAFRPKMALAGEVFSEQWRELVAARAGADPVTDIVSLYGTADAGVLGNETPLSVRIRRFLASRPDLSAELFGDARLPTLVQYDPGARLFEEIEGGTLAFSADGTVPLVRYHIADEGGLFPRDELVERCRQEGFDPGDGPDMPFVYVFGRSLFTVSYFGANVYPENITVGLERPDVAEWTTGRFVVRTLEDADRDLVLDVVVELAPGAEASADRRAVAAESIRAELRRLNSEFAHYVPAERQTPDVELRPADDPEFFPVGVKHRYTRPPG
jgi:phenylacetate-CoA ligase